MLCNSPVVAHPRWLTGTITTGKTPTNASSFTAAIGRRIFFPISASEPRRFSAPCWENKTRWERSQGRTPAGPVTFGRISTDDVAGKIRAYVGNGQFTDDPLDTFGTKAVVKVERLQELLQIICRNGFEHHAAMNGSHCASAVSEALGNYLGWDVYHHSASPAFSQECGHTKTLVLMQNRLLMSRADEIRLMTKVARMYYDQGIRQQEITERLNIHQSTISRLLKRARESNIVRISVAIPLGTFSEMEEALASRFSLREAIVVDSSEDEERLVRDLGAAAAFLVETSVKPGTVIGISSWSRALLVDGGCAYTRTTTGAAVKSFKSSEASVKLRLSITQPNSLRNSRNVLARRPSCSRPPGS